MRSSGVRQFAAVFFKASLLAVSRASDQSPASKLAAEKRQQAAALQSFASVFGRAQAAPFATFCSPSRRVVVLLRGCRSLVRVGLR